MSVKAVLMGVAVGAWTAGSEEPARSPGSSAVTGQMAAMGDNTWLKLPTAGPHPVVRSGSPSMHYAAEAKAAILWGAVHGGVTNDLWVYDMSRNAWKEMLKPEGNAAQNPEVLKLKDAVVMTREEKPLAGHQWGQMDYDPDARALWYLPACAWQGVYTGGGITNFDQAKVKFGFTQKEIEQARAGRPVQGPTLWKYDLRKNQWGWVHTDDSAGVFKSYCAEIGTVRYCPPLRKLVMMHGGWDDSTKFRTYDPATNRWEYLKVSHQPLKPDSKFHSTLGGMLFDPRRNVFVLTDLKCGTWLLDPLRKTLEEFVPASKTPGVNMDGNCGIFVYDSVNGAFLTIYTKANFPIYDTNKHFAKRGFPSDDTYVWALDFDTKEWVLQPPPADRVRPSRTSAAVQHAYFDPARNAVLIYEGSYGGADADTWVYRYKRPKK